MSGAPPRFSSIPPRQRQPGSRQRRSLWPASTPSALPLPRGTVPRQRLIERLLGIEDDVALVLMVAPSGYGKTTVLWQWAVESPLPPAWLQILPVHNDPGRLRADLTLALQSAGAVGPGHRGPAVIPGIAASASRITAPPDAFRLITRPVLLILDNLEAMRTSASLDVIADVVQGVPLGSHVVLSSRLWPRGRIAQLRHQGGSAEFDEADLAFGDDEASALLRGEGVALSEALVAEANARTEGWPGGLHLAAAWLRDRHDVSAAIHELRGDIDSFVQYFKDTVLAAQSVETMRFLLRTAALDRMSASLCDVALDTNGSAAWLTQIRALNLFVVPEDAHGDWFRYHPLFLQALRSELRRREPGEDLKVLRRASQRSLSISSPRAPSGTPWRRCSWAPRASSTGSQPAPRRRSSEPRGTGGNMMSRERRSRSASWPCSRGTRVTGRPPTSMRRNPWRWRSGSVPRSSDRGSSA
jgi:LuxR family transcriptional regulator, maltose regulon positive regulatory protein